MPETPPLILLVEDDPSVRLVYSWFLSKHFRVAEAADGEEGLRKAVELQPSLIITDVRMPNMSGTEMVERLREIPSLREVPVIISSALPHPETRKRLVTDSRVSFFFDKPFTPQDLLSTIEEVLRPEPAKA